MDPAACGAAALCSSISSQRAQVVVAEALHAGMQRSVRDVTADFRSGAGTARQVVIIKRLWDEIALRVQMSPAALSSLLGHTFADNAMATKGLRNRAPGIVVQSFQQMAY